MALTKQADARLFAPSLTLVFLSLSFSLSVQRKFLFHSSRPLVICIKGGGQHHQHALKHIDLTRAQPRHLEL